MANKTESGQQNNRIHFLEVSGRHVHLLEAAFISNSILRVRQFQYAGDAQLCRES